MNTAAIAESAKNITFDYIALESMPEIWPIAAERFGETIALQDPHAKPEIAINYRDFIRTNSAVCCGVTNFGD